MQKLRHVLPLLLLSFSFAGCLISEVTKYRLTLNSDHKSGTFSVASTHVESNASDPAGQKKDFSELLSNWKDDRYLLDQMEKGLYVKKRSVSLEHGKVVWRETAIFSDIRELIPNFDFNDTMRFPLRDTTGLIISSNGRITASHGSLVIQWPPHTASFEVTTQMHEFTPVSSFAERFRHSLKR